MGSIVRLAAVGLAASLVASAGCNLITGANDFEIDEASVEGEGGDGEGAGSASGGSPSTGDGASTGEGASTAQSPNEPVCGDAACDPGEDCETCADDCGACAATCGSGGCDADETCISCPSDCGACAPVCGDGTCDPSAETCSSCAQDCGVCGPSCGDGTCDANESCDTCASDCGACSTCGGAGDATTPLDAEEQAFVGLLNAYRAQNGLGSVSACTSLNRAAQGHSEDMRDQNYFSHTGLNGSTPWDRSCDACYALGCGPQTAMAENIAAGNSGAQATFDQWKNSPGHNANMLGTNFTVVGLGRATGGGTYGVYWTNVFGGDSEASCN